MTAYQKVPADQLGPGLPQDLSGLCMIQRETPGRIARLLAMGDISLSGRVRVAHEQSAYRDLLSEIAPFLHTGDVVFGNLECTLDDTLPPGSLFAAPTHAIGALKDSGFTLLHVANNHIYDFGPAGFSSTLKSMHSAGIEPLGVRGDEPTTYTIVRTDRKGIRIGWIGSGHTLVHQVQSGPHYSEYELPGLLEEVRKAREQVDILVVSLHVGLMLIEYPDPLQREMAIQLQEAGADIVLCHHAHVLQGVEVSPQGRMLVHNLGNAILDWQEGLIQLPVAIQEQRESIILCLDVDHSGVCRAVALPVYVDDGLCVRWATGERGDRILGRLTNVSIEVTGDYGPLFWHQRAERNAGHTLNMFKYQIRHRQWREILSLLSRVRPRHLNVVLYRMLGRKS